MRMVARHNNDKLRKTEPPTPRHQQDELTTLCQAGNRAVYIGAKHVLHVELSNGARRCCARNIDSHHFLYEMEKRREYNRGVLSVPFL